MPDSYPMNRTCPFDPAPELAELRRRPSISRVRLDFDDSMVWLITKYEDACTVLRDTRFSSDFTRPGFPARLTSRPPGPGTFIRMDPPDQTRLRGLLVPEFRLKRVQELRPMIQRIVDRLLDEMIAKGSPADLIESFALPLPFVIITELLGVPDEHREFFYETTNMIGDQSISTAERMTVRTKLRSFLEELVSSKEAHPTGDLLSRILERREGAEVSREEVIGIATLLMVAGYETVASQIGVSTLVLLQHPEQLAELKADPSLMDDAIEELVRHQTVTDYGARRVATEDVRVGGELIRAGEGVLVVLGSANRDESVFADPDRWDMHRGAREHLGFGFGPHQCPGQLLARAQLEIALNTLFRRLPDLKVATSIEEVPFRGDMFVYGVHRLPVTW
ncbi:cytochrome P450 [Streptomyces sp. NPDC002596]|nr:MULTISPECIES: cytochrome P450 [unclassified Streptomyces]MCX4530633.1 cytochrome P450 [Streptomyces sp. NBC_01669]WSA03615.1 cytochrome P450 [Streptomyces sp. NBC_00841]